MNIATHGAASTETVARHVTITPSILYFGTPVALLSTENADATFNLAPMSSAWALGHVVVLGLSGEGHTARNLAERPELVINLPSPHHWQAVERLAPLTGRDPVSRHKQSALRYEPAKFEAAGLRPEPSDLVRPPRVAGCRIQMELAPPGSSRMHRMNSSSSKPTCCGYTPIPALSFLAPSTSTLRLGARSATTSGTTTDSALNSDAATAPRHPEHAVDQVTTQLPGQHQ